MGRKFSGQGDGLSLQAKDDHLAHCFSIVQVGARVCLSCPPNSPFTENRPDELIDDDDRNYEGGKCGSPLRKFSGRLFGQAESDPGLGYIGHPADPVMLGRVAGQQATGERAYQDARHPDHGQEEGNGPDLHQDIKRQRGAGQGKKYYIDGRGDFLENVPEFSPIVAVVGGDEAADHADKQRFQQDLERKFGMADGTNRRTENKDAITGRDNASCFNQPGGTQGKDELQQSSQTVTQKKGE